MSGPVELGGVSVAEGCDGGVEYEGVPDVEGCTVAWLVGKEDGEGISDVINVV